MATTPTSPTDPSDPRRSRAAGFTLIELIVVLTVIALIAAFAIPAGRGALPGFELRAAAEDVAGEARRARAEAIHASREGWIEIDLLSRRYRRAGAAWRGLPQDVGLELETAERELLGDGGGRIRFFPDGAATGGAIRLARGDRSFEVAIDWFDGAVRFSERRQQ